MPVRVSAWAVYDVFDCADGDQVFVGVVSDGQWKSFCVAFEQDDWAADVSLALNNQRVAARDRIIPHLRTLFAAMSKAELLQRCEAANLPFAPIAKPDDLVTDPHLLASEGLVTVTTEAGVSADLPALPLRMASHRAGLRHDVPGSGEHSREIMANALNLDADQIAALERAGAVA
jgi:crotonobetainyl-CoA:carnitine CoA-transferase CaiB-like acyl-CoA transferase